MLMLTLCGLRALWRGRVAAPVEIEDEDDPFSRVSSLSTFSDLAVGVDDDGELDREVAARAVCEAVAEASELMRKLAPANLTDENYLMKPAKSPSSSDYASSRETSVGRHAN